MLYLQHIVLQCVFRACSSTVCVAVASLIGGSGVRGRTVDRRIEDLRKSGD